MNPNIYSVITFEKNHIRLAVLEKTTAGIYCLFNNHLNIDYKNASGIFVDSVLLTNKIAQLINEANLFLEFKITQTIINLGDVVINIASKMHIIKNNESVLDQALFQKIKSELLAQDNGTSELIGIEVVATGWKADDFKSLHFPFDKKAKTIELKYLQYSINNKIHTQYIEMFETLQIKILSITTTEMGLSYLIPEKKNYQFVLNINECYTTISQYKDNILSKIEFINQGNSLIINDLATKLNLPYKDCCNITSNNANLKITNTSFSLINIFNASYLSMNQVTYSGIKNCLNSAGNKLKKSIEPKLLEMVNKIHSCNEIVYVHNNEYESNLITSEYSQCFGNGLIIREFELNIIGIDSKRQIPLIGIVNKIHRSLQLSNQIESQTENSTLNNQFLNQFNLELIAKFNKQNQEINEEK